ncbi:MAG: hypothetical protein AAF333_14210 [Planctomycetota bacterium]
MSQASVTLPLVTLLFVAGLGLTGLFLLITGWRGRRLDDHPVCRHCRFDLTGTPRGEDETPPKCPECGWRREPRIGNRRRSGRRVGAGVLLIGLALLGSGVVGWSRYDAAKVATYKPVWLLRVEARGGTSDAAMVALQELTARVADGELAAAQAEQLVVDALAHGPAGNPAVYHASVGSYWDRLAAELMRGGHADDEQSVALAKSWLDLSVRVRPKVERDAVLPMELAGGAYGPPSDVGLWRTPRQATVTINGVTHPIGYSRSGPLAGGRGFGPLSTAETRALEPSRGLPPDLPLGTHTVRVERPIEITNGPSGAVLAAWTHVEELPFEVVAVGDDSIVMIRNEGLAESIQQAISRDHVELSLATPGRIYGSISFADDAEAIPPFAYRIQIRHGQKTWQFGEITGQANASGVTYNLNEAIFYDWRESDLVDLIFIPSAEVAQRTIGLDQIIGHGFVIPDIPFSSPDGD